MASLGRMIQKRILKKNGLHRDKETGHIIGPPGDHDYGLHYPQLGMVKADAPTS